MQRLFLKLYGVVALAGLVFTAGASVDASYISTVLADNPTGYWRFNETTGVVAANQIASGVAGTYSGTYTQGVAGALSASGDSNKAFSVASAGYVAIDESAISSIGTGDFSIELWFNTTSTGRGDPLCYKSGGSSPSIDFGLIDWGGSVGLYGNTAGKSGTVTVSTNTWYDAVITRASGLMSLYINGQLVASYTNTVNLGGAGHALWIGSNHLATDGINCPFAGSLDELSIYTTALSASQVAAHYAAAVPVPEPSTAILLGGGILALSIFGWRRRCRDVLCSRERREEIACEESNRRGG